MQAACGQLREAGDILGVDTEGSKENLNCIQISTEQNKVFIFDLFHNPGWITEPVSAVYKLFTESSQLFLFQGKVEIDGRIEHDMPRSLTTNHLLREVIEAHHLFPLIHPPHEKAVELTLNALKYGLRVTKNRYKDDMKRVFIRGENKFFERVGGLSGRDRDYAALDVYYLSSHV